MGIIVIRTVIMYLVTVIALRIMGKRQIGEFEPTELVTTILVSEVATLPLQDEKAPLLYAILPICALILLETLSSFLCLKSSRYRRLLAGEYCVLVKDGKPNISQLKKAQVSMEELCEELRLQGIFSLSEVKFCILETGGKMSVVRASSEVKTLPLTLVNDGRLMMKNLKRAGLDKARVKAVAENYGLELSEIFFMSVCDGTYTVVKKEK